MFTKESLLSFVNHISDNPGTKEKFHLLLHVKNAVHYVYFSLRNLSLPCIDMMSSEYEVSCCRFALPVPKANTAGGFRIHSCCNIVTSV